MRVAFITRTNSANSIYGEVRELVEFNGVETEEIVVDHAMFQLSEIAPRAKLYVLRTRSAAAFSAAAALSLAGARFLVPIEQERIVRNRFLVQQALLSAGVPTPRGYMAARADDLVPLLDLAGPLIIKRHDVGAGKGVVIARTIDDLPRTMPGPLYAQEYIEHTSADIKLYGIGSRLFAVRRTFPAGTPEEKRGVAFHPSDELMDIAARCRTAFGLELFGVDVLESARGLQVVDVNSTPGYKGVEGAAELIADLICDRVYETEVR